MSGDGTENRLQKFIGAGLLLLVRYEGRLDELSETRAAFALFRHHNPSSLYIKSSVYLTQHVLKFKIN